MFFRSTYFTLILFIALVSVSTAKNYENKGYKCDTDTLPIKLAVLPISHEMRDLCDTLCILYWSDTGYTEIIKPNQLRPVIAKDSNLLATLVKISEYEYRKEERKNGATLYSILDTGSVGELSSALGDARLMLFPIEMGTKSIGIATNGKINMRLYDLKTGDLIYEKEQTLLVEQVGEDGIKSMLFGLIGFSREHYDKYFFKKFKSSK